MTSPMGIETSYLPGDEPDDELVAVYLDRMDAAPIVPRRTPPVALGVPVNFEEHRDAFRRDWSHKNWNAGPKVEGYVAPRVTPPRVPCRNADEREIPEVAFALGAEAFEAGAHVRVTYAQAGDERILKQSGVCGYCRATTTVNADGALKKHSKPARGKCTGIGSTPVQTDGLKGECADCGKIAKMTKKGLMPSHEWPSEPCDGAHSQEDSIPPRLLPPETLPPVVTIALRIVWDRERWAIGVWSDGDFETGWVCKESTWTDPATKETIMIGRGAREVGITAFSEYVQNQGH